MDTKHELREYMKKQLLEMSLDEMQRQSTLLNQQLISLIKHTHVNTIMLYAAKKREISVDSTIERCWRQWYCVLLPKVVWLWSQVAVNVSSRDECFVWAHRVREPISTATYEWRIDMIIVPWLAFDNEGNRLWKWPGYYDRFLSMYPASYKVWVCFTEQLIDHFPTQAHDVPMEKILSASSWF